MTNLVSHLGEAADAHADEIAVAYAEKEIPYASLWERTGRFATALSDNGVDPDDRVAVYLPNLPQYVTAFFGTHRAGGIVVPMNPQYKAREIAHLLADSGAEIVIALSDLVPFVEEVRDETAVETVVSVGGDAGDVTFEAFLGDDELDIVSRADDDLAVQPYTSGTTGQPKGVLLTHENLASNAQTSADIMPGGTTPEDAMLGVLPLFHIYGMTVTMLAMLFSGAAYYPLPQWDAQQAVGLIEEAELTVMHGVPAMYIDIVNQPDAAAFDLSSLRMGGVGGAGIPVEVLRRFEELYPVQLYEGYGLTETSPVTHFNQPDRHRRIGSIGQPIPGVRSKVIDQEFDEVPRVTEGPVDEGEIDLDEITGEIVISGPNVMRGYYELPAANEAAFTYEGDTRWFHTGDIGYWDEDDFFYVVDREKHVIVSAGYNIYPREVEELLFEHPAVAEAAVVGIPDERRGEIPKAFVVPTPDADVTPEELKQFCLDNLAEYKHPREVEFVDELPRTTTGKVQKFELRKRESDEVEAE